MRPTESVAATDCRGRGNESNRARGQSSAKKKSILPCFWAVLSCPEATFSDWKRGEVIEMHFEEPFMLVNILVCILNPEFPPENKKENSMSRDLRAPRGSQLQTRYLFFRDVWIFYMILVIFHRQM